MVLFIFSQAISIFVDLLIFVESYIVVAVPNFVPKISSPKSEIVISGFVYFNGMYISEASTLEASSLASSIDIAKSTPFFSAEILYGFLVTEAFCGSLKISS